MDKKKFLKLLNNSEQFVFDKEYSKIYFVWNKNIDRISKLNKILGTSKINEIVGDDFHTDDLYFCYISTTNILYCDHNKVWDKIAINKNISSNSFEEIGNLIRVWLVGTKWESSNKISYSPYTLINFDLNNNIERKNINISSFHQKV